VNKKLEEMVEELFNKDDSTKPFYYWDTATQKMMVYDGVEHKQHKEQKINGM